LSNVASQARNSARSEGRFRRDSFPSANRRTSVRPLSTDTAVSRNGRPPLPVGRTDHRLLDMALDEPPAMPRITPEAVDRCS
jgi:hypothetical protein